METTIPCHDDKEISRDEPSQLAVSVLEPSSSLLCLQPSDNTVQEKSDSRSGSSQAVQTLQLYDNRVDSVVPSLGLHEVDIIQQSVVPRFSKEVKLEATQAVEQHQFSAETSESERVELETDFSFHEIEIADSERDTHSELLFTKHAGHVPHVHVQFPSEHSTSTSSSHFLITNIPCSENSHLCMNSTSLATNGSNSEVEISLNQVNVVQVPFLDDTASGEEKPHPRSKRRRILRSCKPEADGFQFLNSYCMALEMATDEKAVEFCQKLGILPCQSVCPSCRIILNRVYMVRKKSMRRIQSRFQCHKRKCKQRGKNQVSLREGTWFHNTSMSFRKNLLIVKCFVDGADISSAIRESSVSEETAQGEMTAAVTSSETVTGLYSSCREVCALSMLTLVDKTVIGGPGKTVELGESTFDRFKHATAVKDHWLLAGICGETDKAFLDLVPFEDYQAALAVVQRHILRGSHIITQCWPLVEHMADLIQLGYSCSTGMEEPSQHNSSKKQNEAKQWQCVRRHFPFARISGGLFALHLAELLWRREHRQDRDPVRSFIGDVTKMFQF